MVWRWDLTGEPFVRDRPLDDPDTDGKRFTFDLRFPGRRYDDVTGLHYNYFRDYDPAVGRYVQSDPIGLRGGVSTYGYVEQQPGRRVDAMGLSSAGAGTMPGGGFAVPAESPGALRPAATALGRLFRVGIAWQTGWTVGTVVNNTIEGTLGSPGTALYDLLNDDVYSGSPECPPGGRCPPCRTISGRVVAVGTISYRPLDVIPDDVMQHGVFGSHHNIFQAHQMPYPKCDCFWSKSKKVVKPHELRPEWIPIEDFAN